MMRWLWRSLKRSRGRMVALGLVGVMVSCVALTRGSGPNHRWVESRPQILESGQFNLPTVEFAPDGRSFLRHDADHALVRDLESGRVVELKLGSGGTSRFDRCMLVQSGWMEGGRLLVGISIEAYRAVDKHPILQVWEMPSGREIYRNEKFSVGNIDYPANLAISDDGGTLVFLCGDGEANQVCFWTSRAGEQIAPFAGKGPIGLSATGRFLVLAEGGASTSDFQVRDLNSGELLGRLRLVGSPVEKSLAISPDGKWVASSHRRDEGRSPYEFAKKDADSDSNSRGIDVPFLSLHEVATSAKRLDVPTNFSQKPWFSPDGLLLFTNAPGRQTGQIEVWSLATETPVRLFQGEVGFSSHDGRTLIQRGDFQNEFLRPLRFVSKLDEKTGKQIPSVRLGEVFQKGRGTNLMSVEGDSLTFYTCWLEASSLWRMTSWLPSQFLPWRPGWKTVQQVEVIDPDSGRPINSIPIDESADRQDLAIVSAGEQVVVQTTRTITPTIGGSAPTAPPRYETTTEVWDVRPRGIGWVRLSLVGLVAALAIGVGGWYDRRANRRAASTLAVA